MAEAGQDVGGRGSYHCQILLANKPLLAKKVAMQRFCDELTQFAIEVRRLAFSLNGGVGERECLDLSERMLAAAKEAEAEMGLAGRVS